MKRLLIFCLLLWLQPVSLFAQIDPVIAAHIGFSVDADTKTGYQKISSLHPDSTFHHDDWFSLPGYGGRGFGVIDTTGASQLASLLRSGANISFSKRMTRPPYSVVPFTYANGAPMGIRTWVDGVYFRDNANGVDSTAFSGSKNGDNPNNWQGTFSQVADKTDIIDVYTHVRTASINNSLDSVWFFAGVSTVSTNGSRYFDIELYRERLSYSPTTKQFTTLGTSFGHSEWLFDASGNVIRTGDIIIAVSYAAGRAPAIDFRIWVSNNTFNTITPKAFKFGTQFNSIGSAGYAQIVSNSGDTDWGTGVSNYSSGSATLDSTYATPWGTLNTKKVWSQHYDQLQFVEVALSFSRFGMNPFALVETDCRSPYSSIMVKSRTSAEFNSSLSDFVGPQDFTIKNLAPFTVKTDTLTCSKTSGAFEISSTAQNFYRWFNQAGDTLHRDSDQLSFAVLKPGTYIVEATNFRACTPLKRDTVVVSGDYYKPVATIDAMPPNPYHQLIGGSISASDYATPFGGSKGLLWNWSGPNGFTSTNQNPKVDTLAGKEFQLVVTEKRNGCTDTAYFNLTALYAAAMELRGRSTGGITTLWWNRPDASGLWQFEIQRSADGLHFTTIGNLAATNAARLYFNDAAVGSFHYRIRAYKEDMAPLFSSVFRVHSLSGTRLVQRTSDRQGILVQVPEGEINFEMRVFDFSGRMILYQALKGATRQRIHLPQAYFHQPLLVGVFKNGQLFSAEKL